MRKTASSFNGRFLTSIFVLIISTIPFVQAQGGAISFIPIDDTYSGCVYGNEPVLKVSRGVYLTFLKFDISEVSDRAIDVTAVLELYTTYDGVPKPRFVAVFPIDNTTWSEETCTPHKFLERYFTEKVVQWVADNETWYEWNVTNIIVKAISNNSDLVAFAMEYDTSQVTSPMLFTSKEGSMTKVPKLTVAWTSVVPLIPTDVNDDGIVNMVDIAIVTVAYGATPESLRWDTRADVDKNNLVNIVDVTLVARDYGKSV